MIEGVAGGCDRPVDIGGLHLGNSLQESRRAVRPHLDRCDVSGVSKEDTAFR